MTGRQYSVVALIALVVVCVTVLGAMQVVEGQRVLDLLGVIIASFLGGMTGAGLFRADAGGRSGSSLAPRAAASVAPRAKGSGGS